MEKLLTPEEAGEYLGDVPKHLLNSWRYQGVGPKYVRLSPRKIRYTKEALDAFIAESTRSSTAVA